MSYKILGFFRSAKCRPDQTLTEADKGASTTPGSWCFPWGAQPGSYGCICVLHHGPVPLLPVRTEQSRAEQSRRVFVPVHGVFAPSALAALLSPLLLLAGGCWTHGLWETGQSLPAGPGSRGAREHPRAAAPLLLWCPLSFSRLMGGFLAISDTLCSLTPKVSCSQKPALSLEVKGRGLQAL